MGILDILIVILLLSWVGGYSVHVGGDLIHLLLVVAVVVLVVRLLRGQKL
jgi:hypothetical protein